MFRLFSAGNSTSENQTVHEYGISAANGSDDWKLRMREIQGALILASLLHVSITFL